MRFLNNDEIARGLSPFDPASVGRKAARVRQRVKMGGHDVPETDILRRYDRIPANLVELYLPLMDRWRIWTSDDLRFEALATSETHVIHDVSHFMTSR